MNRLRDNCPGGLACPHRPRRCLLPHRPAHELVNWLEHWDGDSEDLDVLGFSKAVQM